uniref:NET domain-containing protein n=1 Tax=Pseudictyota dubia TaxID=2749911 RepID=A0A7R9VH89_9STRA|mmetsp:Transcript_14377/g.27323  ORF Transcript_14377/g.27323 Transcript_14377/m.27323 type:complete len:751 (+) Transcript_14377:63-2315(+)
MTLPSKTTSAAAPADSQPGGEDPSPLPRPVRVILRGVMSSDSRLGGRNALRGKWSYEDKDREPTSSEEDEGERRTFEMVRAPPSHRRLPKARANEKPTSMPGKYLASFVFPSAGGDAKIRENNVQLDFRSEDREDQQGEGRGTRYYVTGRGSNRYGRFVLQGECFSEENTAASGAETTSYRVEIEKEYLHPELKSPLKSPSPPRLREQRKRKDIYDPDSNEASGAVEGKKKKRRKSRKQVTRSPAKKAEEEEEMVTREEYNGLVSMAKEMSEQMDKLRSLIEERWEDISLSSDVKPAAVGVSRSKSKGPKRNTTGAKKAQPKRKPASTHRKRCGANRGTKASRPNTKASPTAAVTSAARPRTGTPDLIKERQEAPLTLQEQIDLVNAVNEVEDETMMQRVARIIREAKTSEGEGGGFDDEDEIAMDLSQLNVATQRQLQGLVMKVSVNYPSTELCCDVPATRLRIVLTLGSLITLRHIYVTQGKKHKKSRGLTPKGTSTRDHPRNLPRPLPSAMLNKQQDATVRANARSTNMTSESTAGGESKTANAAYPFMAFGSDDESSASENEDCGGAIGGESEFTLAERAVSNDSAQDIGPIDWSSVGTFKVPVEHDSSHGLSASGSDWEDAKQDAAKLRSCGSDRERRLDRAKAAFSASQQEQLKRTIAQGAEEKSRRAEEEAKQAALREEEDENKRREMREKVELLIKSVEPSVNLNPWTPSDSAVPQVAAGLLPSDLRASACSSRSSSFGFGF